MMASPDTAAYFALEVDKHVDLVPGSPGPSYPESLRHAKIEGEVVLRFVVDTAGRVDTSRVQLIRSDHRYFTDAVRAAMPRMRFLPAEKSGRKVRQWVEQPFNFHLTG